MRVLTMSDAELDKLEIIRDVDLERIPARAAAVVLGISERQVWRLLKRYRLQGAGGLISGKRGQPGNRKTPLAAAQEGVLGEAMQKVTISK